MAVMTARMSTVPMFSVTGERENVGRGVPIGLVDSGMHPHRAEDRCPHRAPCELHLHRETLGDGDHGVLGRVRSHVRHREQPGSRGGVDDMAFALFEQERDEGSDAVDDAPHVDVDHPVPGGERYLPARTSTSDTCVVADDMRRAEGLHNLIPETVDRGLVPDIAHDRMDLCTAGGQFLAGLFECWLLDVSQYHLHPLVREGMAERKTDPARSTRHHRELCRSVDPYGHCVRAWWTVPTSHGPNRGGLPGARCAARSAQRGHALPANRFVASIMRSVISSPPR